MIHITPSQNQIDYAHYLNNNFDFGMRGYADGNKEEQYVGLLGQVILSDFLSLPRIRGSEGFDNGIDFIINTKKVDVKTMGRKTSVQSHYVHNFIGYQIKYNTEYYIFQSYNKITSTMSICGFVSKDELVKKSLFYEKGTVRTRGDGTTFITKSPLYEIKQYLLNPVNSIEDIFNGIKHIGGKCHE